MSNSGQSINKQPDMELINVLYDAIDHDPPAITARALLMEHWMEVGWSDAAQDTARAILQFDPLNVDARRCLKTAERQNGTSEPGLASSRNTESASRSRKLTPLKLLPVPKTNGDREEMEQELAKGYEALRARAGIILRETQLVHDAQNEGDTTAAAADEDGNIQDLKSLTEGRISAVVSVRQPLAARAVARAMEADFEGALDIVVDDLIEVMRWLRTSSQLGGSNNDSIRKALAERIRVIVAALPEELHQHPVTALMHVEHEDLGKRYVNDETMYGDSVADIPRANFFVTEDGYAWDMEELAAAITSNGGVMRNPLSREMFTARDVSAIIEHPHGRKLAAMKEEQGRLSRGVRSTTIDRLDQLAQALLADQSDDQVPSRRALDVFLAYQAILPRKEQNALNTLRVPARDSHTGQSFDCTIGEAVRDAQANKICLHKTGDLIGQAARYLRQSNSSQDP
jgi:hypothetical protein